MSGHSHAARDRIDITRAAITQPIGVVAVVNFFGSLLAISEEHYCYAWVHKKVSRSDIGALNFAEVFHAKIAEAIQEGIEFCRNEAPPTTTTHVCDIFFSKKTYVTMLVQPNDTLVVEIEDFQRDEVAVNPIVDTANVVGKLTANTSQEGTVNDLCASIFHKTSYDRGMTYRFLDDLSGEVVYEIKDDDAIKSSFLGLRFPAGDIPLPARKAYVENSVRFIADVGSSSHALVKRDADVVLSRSFLRGCVEVHKTYLRNMQVVSSLSIAIVDANNRLWGLIALHSYHRPVIPTIEERVSFKLLAAVASSHVQHINNVERQARKEQVERILSTLDADSSLGVFIVVNTDKLLRAFEVDAIALFHSDTSRAVVGKSAATLEELPMDRQTLHYGALHTPPRCFACFTMHEVTLVFTRMSSYEPIMWAGNPGELTEISPDMVMPRKSFEKYLQQSFKSPPIFSEEDRALFDRAHQLFTSFLHQKAIQTAERKIAEIAHESDLVETKSDRDQEFFANMSHELRTPLHAINGIFDIMSELGEDQINPESVRHYSSIGLKTCSNMLKTLNDILHLVKKTQHCEKTQASVVMVKELFGSTASGLRLLAAKHGIALNVSFSCDTHELLRVNAHKTTLIFNNICGNAINFTPRGGKIDARVDVLKERSMVGDMWTAASAKHKATHIETPNALPTNDNHSGDLQKWLAFTVEDDGCGISKDDMPAIFQKFRQIGDVVTKGFSSTGLGLYITQSDVKSMHGFLAVASTLSKGTLFLCALPVEAVVQDNKLGDAADDAPFPSGTGLPNEIFSKKLDILVVDDSKVNVMIAKKQLGKAFENVTVHTAFNGKLAVEQVKRLRGLGVEIDGMFMDFHMPVMSGLEATRLIKAMCTNEKIPVTMLTADITEISRQSMVACGVDFVLTKPSKPEQLVCMCVKMIQLKTS